jgi:hypothetical protein
MFRCKPSFGEVISDRWIPLLGPAGRNVGRFGLTRLLRVSGVAGSGIAPADRRFPVIGRPSGVVVGSPLGLQGTIG